ncbi:MAG: hypothetical protein E6212_04340 [Actinomyces sp.]|nr:hypothetical protein [Actinomyces sp.]MDU5163795.1 hypothetical protein [Actinomyces sp.]
MERPSVELQQVLDAAHQHAESLRELALLINLRRDLEKLPSGWADKSGKKKAALRWGIFVMIYAATEGFFNEVLEDPKQTRVLSLNPDKLRSAGESHRVRLFTREWGVRTRVPVNPCHSGNYSRWVVFEGESLRNYLRDMKDLRDRLAHGGDPFSASNASGALWDLKEGVSMRLMGVEGFFQASIDLVAQTILAFGGTSEDIPEWPEPVRSKNSAKKLPALKLLP